MTAGEPRVASMDAHGDETLTVARNVSTRYLAIAVEAVLGLVVLPFNVAHLGTSAYGLWVLTGSVTTYFSVLDLGYGGVALESSRPEEFEELFHAVLHVPILPPVRVSLRRVYQGPGAAGTTRVGCTFVT